MMDFYDALLGDTRVNLFNYGISDLITHKNAQALANPNSSSLRLSVITNRYK